MYTGGADFQVRLRGMGDRFSHNLVSGHGFANSQPALLRPALLVDLVDESSCGQVHDAPGQVMTPGGPLNMVDHNVRPNALATSFS